jgi:hypothetical protein
MTQQLEDRLREHGPALITAIGNMLASLTDDHEDCYVCLAYPGEPHDRESSCGELEQLYDLVRGRPGSTHCLSCGRSVETGADGLTACLDCSTEAKAAA